MNNSDPVLKERLVRRIADGGEMVGYELYCGCIVIPLMNATWYRHCNYAHKEEKSRWESG